MVTTRYSPHTLAEMDERLQRVAAERGWALAADSQARVYELHPAGQGPCRLMVWPAAGAVQVAVLAAAADDLVRAAVHMSHPDPCRHDGAAENQMCVGAQIPQRIDRAGTKVEDLVGTGQHDAPGG
jgi:hypothetical protein